MSIPYVGPDLNTLEDKEMINIIKTVEGVVSSEGLRNVLVTFEFNENTSTHSIDRFMYMMPATSLYKDGYVTIIENVPSAESAINHLIGVTKAC